jgi:hypothetical protein
MHLALDIHLTFCVKAVEFCAEAVKRVYPFLQAPYAFFSVSCRLWRIPCSKIHKTTRSTCSIFSISASIVGVDMQKFVCYEENEKVGESLDVFNME